MSMWDTLNYYNEILDKARKNDELDLVMRELCKSDLFFLLTQVCHRKDIIKEWLFDRCIEVQNNADGYIDLWAREHYKSTIITFGLTIQDILKDPDITICIFSFNRPIAKSFLRQIKNEFESNELLKSLFPDILFEKPSVQAPRWSEDNGIVVKRKTNPKEATVEAYGLVDGQPTSKHFQLLVYDDCVTRDSVTSPEVLRKVEQAWELSRNIGAAGGKTRYIGTRYHANDLYRTILDREVATPRIYPATEDGSPTGKPVFFDEVYLAQKRREMGSYTFACQMLQDPVADNVQGFDLDWLRFWPADNQKNLNLYFIVDPANQKKAHSDYTAIFIIGMGSDDNYYVVDIYRDKLNLTERTKLLITLHRRYRPLEVFYEKYGKDTDIEHIQYVQENENYRFHIEPVAGNARKEDRIRKLVPYFEANRIYLPDRCIKKDYEGNIRNLTQDFINEEYLTFPVSVHDDMLDCLARIVDIPFAPPGRKRFSKSKGKTKMKYNVYRARARSKR
jgi:predicted phage terminase large subunit-like protein